MSASQKLRLLLEILINFFSFVMSKSVVLIVFDVISYTASSFRQVKKRNND